MSSRTVPKTIEQAFARLKDTVLYEALKEDLDKDRTGKDIKHLLWEYPELNKALTALDPETFVHVTIAALYCERSESVLDKFIRAHFGELEKLEEKGDTRMINRSESGDGMDERYFRMRFVKQVKERIKNEGDADRAQKAATAQAKAASSKLKLSSLTKMKIWILDEDDQVISTLGVALNINVKTLTKLLGRHIRLKAFSLQQAMTERKWASPALREPYERIYLALLDDERAQVVRVGDELRALAMSTRLEAILPPATLPRRPKTPIRM